MTPPLPVTPEATTERSTPLEQTVLCGQQIPDMRDLCVRNGLAGIHPAAELFPLMSDGEMKGLVADVSANGFTTPIAVQDGLVLDGRNRLIASWLSKVPIETRLVETDSPTQYAISENLHRRNLTVGQLAFIGVKALPMLEEEGRRRKAEAGKSAAPGRSREKDVADLPHLSRDKAAEMTGTSGRSVAQAKRIADAAPDLQHEVEAGAMSLNAAEKELVRRKGGAPAAKPLPKETGWDLLDAVDEAATQLNRAVQVATKMNGVAGDAAKTVKGYIDQIRAACDHLTVLVQDGGLSDSALAEWMNGGSE